MKIEKKFFLNLNGLPSYCNLKFQPLEGVYVCDHWSRLVIFLNIFISGDKMMEQMSILTFMGSRNLFFALELSKHLPNEVNQCFLTKVKD